MIVKTKVRLLFMLYALIATGCTKMENTADGWKRQVVVLSNNNTEVRSIHVADGHMQYSSDVIRPELLSSNSPGISMQSAMTIFNEVALIDTFVGMRYFKDGHFARSHAMGRYIAGHYGVHVEKIFAFGELTAFSRWLDCYANWAYDVACVIRVDHEQLVFDPKLFTKPVDIHTWLDAHVKATPIRQTPSLRTHLITSREAFTPVDAVPSGFVVDTNYVYTQAMLAYYQDSVGCGSILF